MRWRASLDGAGCGPARGQYSLPPCETRADAKHRRCHTVSQQPARQCIELELLKRSQVIAGIAAGGAGGMLAPGIENFMAFCQARASIEQANPQIEILGPGACGP